MSRIAILMNCIRPMMMTRFIYIEFLPFSWYKYIQSRRRYRIIIKMFVYKTNCKVYQRCIIFLTRMRSNWYIGFTFTSNHFWRYEFSHDQSTVSIDSYDIQYYFDNRHTSIFLKIRSRNWSDLKFYRHFFVNSYEQNFSRLSSKRLVHDHWLFENNGNIIYYASRGIIMETQSNEKTWYWNENKSFWALGISELRKIILKSSSSIWKSWDRQTHSKKALYDSKIFAFWRSDSINDILRRIHL